MKQASVEQREASLWMHLRPDGREDLSFHSLEGSSATASSVPQEGVQSRNSCGDAGEPDGPWASEWHSARPHSLSGTQSTYNAQAEGRSEPRTHVRMRARSSRWWHRWNQPRSDGNTGIPEDAKSRARQCPWTIWSHDHRSGRQRGQVTTQDSQHQGLQI